jgi:predicted ABC-class ATPase
MLPSDRLRDKLVTMNNKNVQVYQELVGAYRFERFVLSLETIPPDPVVAPAQARVRVDRAESQVPPELWASAEGRVAVQDFLARAVHEAIRRHVHTRWSGRIAPMAIDPGGQEILLRSNCALAEDHVEVRLAVGLPAESRKVQAKPVQTLFFEELPAVVNAGLIWPNLDADAGRRHIAAVEDYAALRDALPAHGLVAFLADGALTARESGPSDGPLRGRGVALRTPDDLAVTIPLPHAGPVRGWGIPQGVTVLAGGGFQGKTTVVRAIGRGVYPHIPGDGRELVATVPDAVTIRAEPGRRIERVDVSAFVREVPTRFDMSALSLEHATGPVSMAAGIAEALEIGTRLLIFDEDDAAVAFLARDAVLQQLVPKTNEPLARLLDVVRALWEHHGVSSLIATSGLGDYIDVADTVVVLDGYQPTAATARARALVAGRADRRVSEAVDMARPASRCPQPRSFGGLRGRRAWVEVRGRGWLNIGREAVDWSAFAQMVDANQARAAGDAILYALEKGYIDGSATIGEAIERVFGDVQASGLSVLAQHAGQPADYALPRPHDVAAIMNRIRSFQARSRRSGADAADAVEATSEAAMSGAPAPPPAYDIASADGPVVGEHRTPAAAEPEDPAG